MTDRLEHGYDARVEKYSSSANWCAIEKRDRGGPIDVRSTDENPPRFYVVLRIADDVDVFSIADLMNRPPRRYR